MERVLIADIAVAHPALRITQSEAAANIARITGDHRRVAALARGTRIGSRAICVSPIELASLTSIAARNDVYRRLTPPLAFECTAAVLGETPRETVSAIVSSSCTGYALPGWASGLVPALGLPIETVRVPITEAGCAGGVVAIALAAEHLRHRPGMVALATAVELCSLSFGPVESESALAASLIFGDGAGAALLTSGEGRGIEIVDAMSVLVPNSAGALGFDLTDGGFTPVLARALPELLATPTFAAVERLLARNRLVQNDISAWLIHPGGARILRSLETVFGLEHGRARWSWDSMAEFGNTSSAAIFDVLRRYLRSDMPNGYAVAAAFGPGVSIELLLVHRWC